MLADFLAQPDVEEFCGVQRGERGQFGVMAYHGGNLERSTDAIAREVAARTGASLYVVTQAPPNRRHLASTAFDPAHSDALARFLEHVRTTVTIHGYGRRNLRRHVLLGGQNRVLATHIAGHLRDHLGRRYSVVDELETIPKELRGQHARNPVNRPPERGVQIELPPSIRWNWREWGWSDHAGVSRTAGVGQVIDGLTRAIECWHDEPGGRDSQNAEVAVTD